MQNEKVQVKACAKCHGLFQTIGDKTVCPLCLAELEILFKKVRSYVRSHDMAGIEEVSEKCNVKHKQLLEWIREERLAFSKESKVGVPCLSCGITIQMGKYCTPCQTRLSKNLSSVAPVFKKEELNEQIVTKSNKMHFLGHTR